MHPSQSNTVSLIYKTFRRFNYLALQLSDEAGKQPVFKENRMLIIYSHIFRLVIDLGLLGLMLYLEIYEFTLIIVVLIVFRVIVGHVGRIFQYMFGSLDDMEGLLTGVIANAIKTALESAILLSLYDDISTGVTVIVILCILVRNTFEAVSLCEEFSD